MSEPVAIANVQKNNYPIPNVTRIKGRVEISRSHEGKRYTQVMTPAEDAYSRPQLLEIRSKSALGGKGEEIDVFCRLGGYQRKAYQYKDKNTGEVITIVPVDHTLDLVE